MVFGLIGLAAYIAYIPIFLTLLVLVIKKYKRYSILTGLVSDLGSVQSPRKYIFNISLSLFGILSLFFVLSLSNLLPDSYFSKIGLFFLLLTCVSTTCLGLFPQDTASDHHTFFGRTMLIGVAGAAFFMIYPIYFSSAIPDFVLVINLLILVSIVFFVVSNLISGRRKQISKVLVREIAKNKGLWEWAAFLLAVFWDFVMASITLTLL